VLRQLSVDYFARSPVLAYPVLALAIFLTVFIVVSVRALRARREDVERMAALPLSDSSDSKVSDHV
jgi:hypothetical protein